MGLECIVSTRQQPDKLVSKVRFRVDDSRKLENMVYIHLRRTGHRISYYRTRKGYEVDFVALPKKPRGAPSKLCQVCLRFDSAETLQRELRGVPETVRFLKLDEAWIITLDHDETVTVEGVPVRVVPAWKWMLEP